MTRMSDQEGKVELVQNLSWYDGRISGFGNSVVGIRGRVVAVGIAIGDSIRLAVGADTFLDSLSAKRRCYRCSLAFRRGEIMCNILYEEAFSLFDISSRIPIDDRRMCRRDRP